MKWMIVPAVLMAAMTPQALADLAGPAEIPVQIPLKRAPVGPLNIQFQGAIALQIPENISGVSLGNSHIANVAVHDKHTIIITGRAYGTTSLHVMDDKGRVVVDTTIHVVDVSQTRLTLNRGGIDFTMDCAPNCRPAPNIGDDEDYFLVTTDQAGILARDQ